MERTKALCGCGQAAVGRDGFGTPLCVDCARVDIMTYLRKGQGVTVSVNNKLKWTHVPHLDQNRQLAFVVSRNAETGELLFGTYPAGQ